MVNGLNTFAQNGFKSICAGPGAPTLICFLEVVLQQPVSRKLDGCERVLDLMGHAARHFAPGIGLLCFEQLRQIFKHHHATLRGWDSLSKALSGHGTVEGTIFEVQPEVTSGASGLGCPFNQRLYLDEISRMKERVDAAVDHREIALSMRWAAVLTRLILWSEVMEMTPVGMFCSTASVYRRLSSNAWLEECRSWLVLSSFSELS